MTEAAKSVTLDTPAFELHKFAITRLGQKGAERLALALAQQFGKSDLRAATVADLLNYFPARYEDRSSLTSIGKLYDGLETAVELQVRVAGGYQVGRNRGPRQPQLFIFEVTASDPGLTGRPVVVWWFLSGKQARNIIQYHRQRFVRGARFIAFGKWEWDARRNTFALKLNRADELEMLPDQPGAGAPGIETENDDAGEAEERFEDDEASSDPALSAIHVGRRVPVYRKLGEIGPKRLREIMHAVLTHLRDADVRETIPLEIRTRQRLQPFAKALREIHFPPADANLAEYERARSPAQLRLIFEEFFWLAMALGIKRGARIKEPKGPTIELSAAQKAKLQNLVPFKLTGAQDRAVAAIFADLQSNAPMNRLLQGDVGSGKTIVAVQAMLAAIMNGYQAALMVPTEILAEQHLRNIRQILAATEYEIELLTGSLKAREKRLAQARIASGEAQIAIGTHALIQESVTFHNLGLVVIDEQHRFGVLQRAQLRERGLNPDVLVLTATPIPRSLAMALYGDMDVTTIDELPPGRTPVKTVVVGEDQRAGVYKGIEREVGKGRQVYVIYPLVEESEKMDLKDATRMYEQLRDSVFPKRVVGLLHGKLATAEKDAVMRAFTAGTIQILVATTVVEVGVDVANASLMVIEHAERFGLSQLHQLRGRVGRGAEESFCVLLSSEKQTVVAQQRLGIMEKTNDGFKIAEKDLEIRGPGDLLGTRQAGLPTFRIANLVRDVEILTLARKEADEVLSVERASAELQDLIKHVTSDPRFHLASIG